MSSRPDRPEAHDVTAALIEQQSHDMHTSFHARVQHYYADRGAADLVPLIRSEIPQPDGSIVYDELPVLPHVPVVFPRAGHWGLVFRLEPGDTVLVHCCEAQNGHWWAGADDPFNPQSTTFPGDPRRFDLSHAVCVPGLHTRTRAWASAPTQDGDVGLVLGKDDGTRLAIKTDGSVELSQGGSVVLRVAPNGDFDLAGSPAADFVALAALVTAQLNALKAAIAGAPVTPGDGGAAFKAAIGTALAAWPGNVAATKVKAT